MASTEPNRSRSTSEEDVDNPKLGRKTPPVMCVVECFNKGFLRKVGAEVIATYIMVFVTCGTAAIYEQGRGISKLGACMAGGLIVTVMIDAFGCSHEPCCYSCLCCPSPFSLESGLVPFYGAAQVTGSICASLTLKVLLDPIKHVGTTSPSGSDLQALIMEIVVTFTMMFVASAVATDTKAIGELAGLAVGASVCITSILAGPISGGSMDPARTLGPAIASSYYKGIWVYFVGPVVGTLLGAWSYNLIRATDEPVQPISPRSFSLTTRGNRSNIELAPNEN